MILIAARLGEPYERSLTVDLLDSNARPIATRAILTSLLISVPPVFQGEAATEPLPCLTPTSREAGQIEWQVEPDDQSLQLRMWPQDFLKEVMHREQTDESVRPGDGWTVLLNISSQRREPFWVRLG